ncbi:MAG: hypothetical protein C0622_10415, partial [Desulfuromonas sp.]
LLYKGIVAEETAVIPCPTMELNSMPGSVLFNDKILEHPMGSGLHIIHPNSWMICSTHRKTPQGQIFQVGRS